MPQVNALRSFAWLALVIPSVLSVAFFLLGTPPAKAIPYSISAGVTVAAVFGGIVWFALACRHNSDRTVFRVIGGSLILMAVVADVQITLWYRYRLHDVINDGGLYATLLMLNAATAILLLLLPTFAAFASGLSTADRAAKSEITSLTSQLKDVEQQFFTVSRRLGKRYLPSDRPVITQLRERSQFLSPTLNTLPRVSQIEAEIHGDVQRLAILVNDATPPDASQFDLWLGRIEEICDRLLHSFDRREKQLIA